MPVTLPESATDQSPARALVLDLTVEPDGTATADQVTLGPASVDPAPAVPLPSAAERGGRWARMLRVLTHPPTARARLHELNLAVGQRTWI